MKTNFVREHLEIFILSGLGIIFAILFFVNLGNYPLTDIDETRYASMARDMFLTHDFLTLKLNGEYFFEKPPLYFWPECLSFLVFGKINEFTVRFPVALTGFISSFVMYFFCKRVVSRRFGIISALIFATCAEFLILSKFAILDAYLAFFVQLSVTAGFMTFFVSERFKKYFWMLFYLFSGAAVMAKGIPGVAIPFATMFFASIVTKNFKQIFKPANLFPGLILFAAVAFPWHIIMLKMHNPEFFNEYVMRHHVARFLNSESLGRKQPFWFFVPTLMWGLFPWIFGLVFAFKKIFVKIFDFCKKYFEKFSVNDLSERQKFFAIHFVGALLTFLFFSVSSTKLVTYILPIYFFVAPLITYIWEDYISAEGCFDFTLKISSVTFGVIFFVAGIACCFAKCFLPDGIYADIKDAQMFCSLLFTVAGASIIFFALKQRRKFLFATFVVFMMLLSAFGMPKAYNIDYKFGQNDLIGFAKYARDNNLKLASFGFGKRYSLNFYYDKHVYYEVSKETDILKKLLSEKDTVIVVKNKDIEGFLRETGFDIIFSGRKYSLLKGDRS